MANGVVSISLDEDCSQPGSSVSDGLIARFPLRDFISDDQTRLATVAVNSVVAEVPAYNPVVVVGPTGTGKSHLTRILISRWQQKFGGRKLVVTTGSDFVRSFATALDTDGLSDFRVKYRGAAMFVLDDLDELMGKPAAQRELARSFDALFDRRVPVVVTARRLPNELDNIDAALASRLTSGLTVPLAAPGAAARREILDRLSRLHDVSFPANDFDALNHEISGTVPELNHVVLHLAMARKSPAESQQADTTISLAKETLKPEPALREIAKRVAHYFSLTASALRGASRRKTLVHARGIAMFLGRELTSNSLEQIGRFFNGRDHTTVMHACHKIATLLKSDPATRTAVDEIKRRLENT